MPFKSESQRRYLWANEPEVAQEFADKTPKRKVLPFKLHPGKGRKKLKPRQKQRTGLGLESALV